MDCYEARNQRADIRKSASSTGRDAVDALDRYRRQHRGKRDESQEEGRGDDDGRGGAETDGDDYNLFSIFITFSLL